ncbi:MAG: MarR family winged helix-turn-helix transcriptional regulator [Pseudonocardiaceae bacterium]
MRELAVRLHELIVASDQYRHAVAAALRVGVPEAVTLDHVYHAGQLTPTAIADRLSMTTASVTGLLDRLADSGYLVRKPNPRDRRSILITLTDDGQRALQALFDLFVTDMEHALSGSALVELAPGLERLLAQAAAALHQRANDSTGLTKLLAAKQGHALPCGTPEPADPPDGSPV